MSYLNDLITTALERVMTKQPNRVGVEVAETLSDDLASIVVERNKLVDICEGIIRNAVESMPDGGRLFISSELCEKNNQRYISVLVRDTGTGISESDLPHIFDLYFTTKTNGVGFGLWQAKNFIRSIGGSIDVRSSVGHGTKFTILLPITAK